MSRKKMNRVCIFLFFCATDLYGQSGIIRVTDASSGAPVSGVSVKVANSNSQAVTDEKGTFKFETLPPESKLLISAAGFQNLELQLTDSTSSIQLERSPVYLYNNITITGKRFETNHFDISEGVNIVNGQELHQTVPRSAPEALMGTTGIWVQKTNHGGGSPIIRGLIGNQILLMVDGIRMNNATYRYGPNQYLSTIDPGLIERMEATRGNGSVLYGSDALGGVVQIISRSPVFHMEGNQLHGKATGKWMNGGMEKSGRAEFQWSNEKVAALGGFSMRKFGDIIAGGSLGRLHPTGYHEFATDSKLLIKTGMKGVMTAAFQYHQQNDVPRYDQVAQGGYRLYNFDPQIRQLSYVRWETFSENRLTNTIRITGAINKSVERVASQKSGSDEITNQEDVVTTFSGTAEVHSIPGQTWQAHSGFDWYYDLVDSNAKVFNTTSKEEIRIRGFYADQANSRSAAIFSTHTYDIKKFNFSAGARFTAVSLSVNDAIFGDQKIRPGALVGNLGIAYSIDPGFRLFLNGNTGFRAPNIDDVSKFGAVEGRVFEIPSGNLSPEKSRSMEAGLKVKKKIYSGSVTVYQTTLIDLIERMPVSYQGRDSIEGRKVYQKQNVSESSLHGFELEGEIKVSSKLNFYGNLSYTYGENISKNEPMRRIPPVFGKLGLRYQYSGDLWFRIDYLSAGKQDRLARGDLSDGRISARLRNGVMPSWNIVNVYTGYSYKFLSLVISGQNLFNEPYRVYASGIDGYGRSVSVSVTGKF